MRSLIEAAAAPDHPAEIALVLSNRPEAAGLAFAQAKGIAAVALDHKAFDSREAFDKAVDAVLRDHSIEFVACAGYMRIMTAWFVARWAGRMINIHPALLPAYKGLQTHERVLTDGAAVHGCTVHWVSEGVDEGKIIAQAKVPVLQGDTPESLAARVLAEEHKLYPEALALAIRQLKTS